MLLLLLLLLLLLTPAAIKSSLGTTRLVLLNTWHSSILGCVGHNATNGASLLYVRL